MRYYYIPMKMAQLKKEILQCQMLRSLQSSENTDIAGGIWKRFGSFL
jgi:hypothetical protein